MIYTPLKFYVATGLEHHLDADIMADALIQQGHEQTYRWTKHGSVQHDESLWLRTALAETTGVRSADVVIVLIPGGRGTHTELGIALGCEKPVLMVGMDRDEPHTCIFYHHPFVHHVKTMDEAVEWMRTFDLEEFNGPPENF